MNSPTSHTTPYLFTDALISPKTAAVDVSFWFSKVTNLYSAKVIRIQRRQKWIKLSRGLRSISINEKLSMAKSNISSYIFGNATKLLWRVFTRKMLFHSRIFNLKFYCAKLQHLYVERHNNIRIQWKAYSHALLYGTNAPDDSYRELWISYAFLLRKRNLRNDLIKYQNSPFHGTDETREFWIRYARILLCHHHIRNIKTYVEAIKVLTGFFNHALSAFKVKKAAESCSSIDCNYSFVKPFVKQSCLEVNHFARIWLTTKASKFSVAYADETYKTTFIHVLNSISQSKS